MRAIKCALYTCYSFFSTKLRHFNGFKTFLNTSGYLHWILFSIGALGWKTERARANSSKARIPLCFVSNKSNTYNIREKIIVISGDFLRAHEFICFLTKAFKSINAWKWFKLKLASQQTQNKHTHKSLRLLFNIGQRISRHPYEDNDLRLAILMIWHASRSTVANKRNLWISCLPREKCVEMLHYIEKWVSKPKQRKLKSRHITEYPVSK